MEIDSISKFVEKNLELLEKEREAEIEETRVLQEQVPVKELQRKGVCLLKLKITNHSTGLYGRTVVVFEPPWEGTDLPSHKFTPGDIAGLQPSQGAVNPSDLLASGIVSKVAPHSVTVAFEDAYDQLDVDSHSLYRLVKLANDVTYRRLKKGLEELRDYRENQHRHLVDVLFGLADLGPPLSQTREGIDQAELHFVNTQLDSSQQEAVKFALNQRELAIIHGPPGTGKTTTLTEVILQAVKLKLKLLVCAPSNIAVDNLVEKLAGKSDVRMVRVGHPARVLPTIQRYSLDAVLATSDETQLVKDVRKDIDKALAQLKRTRDKGERQRITQNLKYLRKELHYREKKAIQEILRSCNVVLGTLTMATSEGPLKHMKDSRFDILFIDECSQSMEAACWMALLKAPKCILAGDPQQLPPTIISREAAKGGLEVTLMERLMKQYGDPATRMLTTQYRMHQDIMTWPSQQLYSGRLQAHDSVATHLLKDLEGLEEVELTQTPLLLIDTAGCDLTELQLSDEMSKGNEGEADLVTHHVEKLVETGLKPEHIGVITPYILQVELLRIRLSQKFPTLEIKSVDGFQGREKEAIIISLVRSNPKGVVGFLEEDRRINVAITRARRHLAVICDSETVSHHKFLKDMVGYLTEHGEVHSAQEYIHEGAMSHNIKRPEHLEDKLTYTSQQGTKGDSKETSNRPESQTNKAGKKSRKQPKAAKNEQKKGSSDVKKDSTTEQENNAESAASERTKEQIEKTLVDFVVDDCQQRYSFPSTLSSKERRIVHEICENLGLEHVSHGADKERYIMVNKVTKSQATAASKSSAVVTSSMSEVCKVVPSNCSKNGPVVSSASLPTSSSGPANKSHHRAEVIKPAKTPEKANSKHCDKCGRDIPLSNYELHILRCSVPKPQPDVAVKPKKTSKKTPTPTQSAPDDDFDALVAAAEKENKSCRISKCKGNATMLGQNCQFCHGRFCLQHFIAEAHGCGPAAKARARASISREGVLYPGSGIPSKLPDPTKRVHLQRRLNAKLQDLSDKRTAKKKE